MATKPKFKPITNARIDEIREQALRGQGLASPIARQRTPSWTRRSPLSCSPDEFHTLCDMAIASLSLPSPCGHSSQYAYTENGGKVITCLLCERAAAAPTERPHCQNGTADVCKAAQQDGVVCPDDSCDIDDGLRKAATPYEQMVVGNHSIGVFKDGKLIAADAQVWAEFSKANGETPESVMRRALVNIASISPLSTASPQEIAKAALAAAGALRSTAQTTTDDAKNAARYRWMRENDWDSPIVRLDYDDYHTLKGEQLDAAIDEEMR